MLRRVHALAEKDVGRALPDPQLGRGEELESARLARRRALGHYDRARDEDGIEEVVRDLAVCSEAGDARKCRTIVFTEVVN